MMMMMLELRYALCFRYLHSESAPAKKQIRTWDAPQSLDLGLPSCASLAFFLPLSALTVACGFSSWLPLISSAGLSCGASGPPSDGSLNADGGGFDVFGGIVGVRGCAGRGRAVGAFLSGLVPRIDVIGRGSPAGGGR
jgi:hypothetical protein